MTAIKCNRRNTASYTVTVSDTDGDAIDITGYTVKFTVKKNTNDLDNDDVEAIIAKTVTTHTTPVSGITTISLTTSDTTINPGTYMYDLKFKNVAGDWVKSTEADKFIVRGVVTNS